MAEVLASILLRTSFLSPNTLKRNMPKRCRAHSTRSVFKVTMQAEKATSFASELSTDLPLYESSQAPFDQYLSDRQRVFQAMFPDRRRSEKLNDEEWRIHMLPIEFLFLSTYPVIDMRTTLRTSGQGYPVGISKNVNKVLTLEVTRWDLRGLDNVFKPSDFVLEVRGALYSEKRGVTSRLRGHLEISISFVLPPALALVPEEILKNVAHSVLLRLLENMKEKVNKQLLADYKEYIKEQRAAIQDWGKDQAITPAI